MFRNEYRNARPAAGKRHPPLHRKVLCDRTELIRKVLQVQLKPVQVPLDASQIVPLLICLVLLEMKDVSAMTVDEVSDRGVEAFAIRTLNQENGRVSQALPPASEIPAGAIAFLIECMYTLCMHQVKAAAPFANGLPAIK
jgi:hypothetical protein